MEPMCEVWHQRNKPQGTSHKEPTQRNQPRNQPQGTSHLEPIRSTACQPWRTPRLPSSFASYVARLRCHAVTAVGSAVPGVPLLWFSMTQLPVSRTGLTTVPLRQCNGSNGQPTTRHPCPFPKKAVIGRRQVRIELVPSRI